MGLRVVRLSVGIARYRLVRSTVTCMYMCVYYVFLLLQRRCLINGTTTACYFSTIHLETSKLLADIVGECQCTVDEHTHVCAHTHTHTFCVTCSHLWPAGADWQGEHGH